MINRRICCARVLAFGIGRRRLAKRRNSQSHVEKEWENLGEELREENEDFDRFSLRIFVREGFREKMGRPDG